MKSGDKKIKWLNIKSHFDDERDKKCNCYLVEYAASDHYLLSSSYFCFLRYSRIRVMKGKSIIFFYETLSSVALSPRHPLASSPALDSTTQLQTSEAAISWLKKGWHDYIIFFKEKFHKNFFAPIPLWAHWGMKTWQLVRNIFMLTILFVLFWLFCSFMSSIGSRFICLFYVSDINLRKSGDGKGLLRILSGELIESDQIKLE